MSTQLASIAANSIDPTQMLDQIGLAAIATDSRGKIIYANRCAGRMYGWSPSEMLGMHILRLSEPEAIRDSADQVVARWQKDETWSGEILMRHRDGRIFPVSMTNAPLLDGNGTPVGVIGISRDISELKRITKELRDSEEHHRVIFECNPLPMWVYDMETLRFLAVNQTAINEYGYSEEEFLAMTIRDIRPTEELARLEHRMGELKLGAKTVGTWRHKVKSGAVIDVEVSSDSILYDGRRARLVLASNVTERRAAEEKLVQSEALLRITDSAARLGGWTIDFPDQHITWSREVCAIHEMPYGTSPTLEQALAFYAPEWRDAIRDAIADCVNAGTPFDLELEIITANGRRVWVRAIGQALRDSNGKIARVHGVFQDIGERKNAEHALRESEQRFRELAENIQEVFYVFNPHDGRAVYVSPAYETVWGRSCESLYVDPTSFREAIHEDDRAIADAAATQQLAGLATDEQYRIIKPDGELRWVRDRAYVVRDADGAVVRVVGVVNDITERRLAGERLREQASLLDKAQDAIMVRDLEHRITYWNKSAERLYGWTAEEAIGRSAPELLQQDYEGFQAACEKVMQDGEWVGELQQTGKGSHNLVVESHWTLVRDGSNRPRSILSIETNITDKKRMEQQFLRAQRMESIGTLAGGIAHDLNNVLAPIIMAIDLLKLSVRAKDDLELLEIIAGSAKRGADMVGQVLSFARGVDGQRVEVQPRHLIEDIESIIRDTFPKNIEIRTRVSPELWVLLGDPTQLHQVLLNLCVNARDAMADGGRITISAENVHLDAHYVAAHLEAAPGPYVAIQVEDNGSGIPEAIIDKIFDPFFTTKDIGKGTGLGLSTSAGIVKSHGGFIRVYSEKSKGTVFHIYLPAQSRVALQMAEKVASSLPRGNGQTLLIVDDEAPIRLIAQQTLQAYGYRVLLAADGAEAVALYAQQLKEIDVVVMDIMMPVMDGPATIQVLMKLNPNAQIIGASGMAANESVARATAAGAKYFLAKPYTAETILKLLDRVLRENA